MSLLASCQKMVSKKQNANVAENREKTYPQFFLIENRPSPRKGTGFHPHFIHKNC